MRSFLSFVLFFNTLLSFSLWADKGLEPRNDPKQGSCSTKVVGAETLESLLNRASVSPTFTEVVASEFARRNIVKGQPAWQSLTKEGHLRDEANVLAGVSSQLLTKILGTPLLGVKAEDQFGLGAASYEALYEHAVVSLRDDPALWVSAVRSIWRKNSKEITRCVVRRMTGWFQPRLQTGGMVWDYSAETFDPRSLPSSELHSIKLAFFLGIQTPVLSLDTLKAVRTWIVENHSSWKYADSTLKRIDARITELEIADAKSREEKTKQVALVAEAQLTASLAEARVAEAKNAEEERQRAQGLVDSINNVLFGEGPKIEDSISDLQGQLEKLKSRYQELIAREAKRQGKTTKDAKIYSRDAEFHVDSNAVKLVRRQFFIERQLKRIHQEIQDIKEGKDPEAKTGQKKPEASKDVSPTPLDNRYLELRKSLITTLLRPKLKSLDENAIVKVLVLKDDASWYHPQDAEALLLHALALIEDATDAEPSDVITAYEVIRDAVHAYIPGYPPEAMQKALGDIKSYRETSLMYEDLSDVDTVALFNVETGHVWIDSSRRHLSIQPQTKLTDWEFENRKWAVRGETQAFPAESTNETFVEALQDTDKVWISDEQFLQLVNIALEEEMTNAENYDYNDLAVAVLEAAKARKLGLSAENAVKLQAILSQYLNDKIEDDDDELAKALKDVNGVRDWEAILTQGAESATSEEGTPVLPEQEARIRKLEERRVTLGTRLARVKAKIAEHDDRFVAFAEGLFKIEQEARKSVRSWVSLNDLNGWEDYMRTLRPLVLSDQYLTVLKYSTVRALNDESTDHSEWVKLIIKTGFKRLTVGQAHVLAAFCFRALSRLDEDGHPLDLDSKVSLIRNILNEPRFFNPSVGMSPETVKALRAALEKNIPEADCSSRTQLLELLHDPRWNQAIWRHTHPAFLELQAVEKEIKEVSNELDELRRRLQASLRPR